METNKSILRTLLLSFLTFGMIMGILFPLYAQFFVDWKPGMKFWFIVGCLVAGSTVGIINFWLVKLILISNLKQIAQVASKIADRDLSQHCHIDSNDIVGSIVASINQMNEGLRELMQQLTSKTRQMTEISKDMHSNTQATHEHATTLHHQSDQVAAAMTELTASAHELSNNARISAETTQTAEHQAQTGVAAVSTNRENIELLAQEITQAKETVAQVETSSKRIDSILHVVQGISEQTNLLALNAAIEAARAGDHGRGFAVVADEVRTLASRTQDSTHEIQEIIADLRQSVQQTVDIMVTSNERANTCLNRAGNVKDSLTAILASVDSLGNISLHFSNATHEQQQVTEEVSRTLLEIQSTAHNTVTYTAATTEVSTQLKSLANEMDGLIATIKL